MIRTPARAPLLQRKLRDARARTLAHAAHLAEAELLGPRLPIVNPPLWELGHIAWFQERWCLREQRGSLRPSLLANADRLYDSSRVAHATRWSLPLPTLDATLAYLASVLDMVLAKIADDTDQSAYFAELAALHEEMHCEAFSYTRQTLGMRPPAPDRPAHVHCVLAKIEGDVEITGGEFTLGALPDSGFVFDNEKWAHPVALAPFRIARACVTNGELLAFVEERGYSRRELWSDAGWMWRSRAEASHPVYWKRQDGGWLMRVYDEWWPLAADAAAVHVNWHEAEAYCRWAGRRLPSEAEWEFAASTTPGHAAPKRHYPWGNTEPDATRANLYGAAHTSVEPGAYSTGDSAWGCRQMVGNVWEWTADWFLPYPGFIADPYADYSQPWFGDHKVLRGGSFATRDHLIRNTWRNFHTPDRRDVYAGFRTCAPLEAA
jgi:iron(II)-dependent oxidoreductase